MVFILPKRQSFGEKLGTGLGAGLGSGLQQASQFAQEMAMEKAKQDIRFKKIQNLRGGQQPQQDLNQRFLDSLPEIERNLGRDLNPQDLDQIYASMGQKSQQQEDPFDYATKLSLAGEPELARIEMEKGKLQAKEESRKAERESVSAEKYLDEARKSKEELFAQQTSLDSAMQGIREGKNLKQDFWADFLGLPQLKTAPGAVIDATAKTHMLSAINNLSGGRPNMFLEKQVSQAFALPGSSPEANMAKLEILKSLADMKQFQIDKAFEIEDRFEKMGKPIPGKIGRLALKEAEPAIQKRQKTLAYKLQDLMEPKEGSPELEMVDRVAKGTPLTTKKAEVIFRQANPGKNLSDASEEEIARAIQLAEGLGYDVYAHDNLE